MSQGLEPQNDNKDKPHILVSVLTPAFNAQLFIDQCIESILGQTYGGFEYIIVDDASTDDTWKMLESWQTRDPRISIFRNRTNLGIAGTRNRLKSLAQGKYIVWQDADDISMPYRIQRQLDVMEADLEIGICGGGLQFFNARGDLHKRLYSTNDRDLRMNIFRYSPVSQPAAMIRRSILEKVGEYDVNYPPAEDLDMSFRIGMVAKFANISEIAIKYRETLSGATFTRLKVMELNTISIRLRYANSKFYRMNFGDHLYNILQYISIFVIPPRAKIALFSLFRNSK